MWSHITKSGGAERHGILTHVLCLPGSRLVPENVATTPTQLAARILPAWLLLWNTHRSYTMHSLRYISVHTWWTRPWRHQRPTHARQRPLLLSLPLSSSLNIQISVNIFAHARAHAAEHKECNIRELCSHRGTICLPFHFHLHFPAPTSPTSPQNNSHFQSRLPWATIRSISCNQVILIHYPYATNTWETCSQQLQTLTPRQGKCLGMPWQALPLWPPLNHAIVSANACAFRLATLDIYTHRPVGHWK